MEYIFNTRLRGNIALTDSYHTNLALQKDNTLYKFIWVQSGSLQLEIDHVPTTLVKGEMLRILLKRFIILCTRIAREKFSVSPEREKAFDMVRQFYVLVDNHFKEKKMVQDYADMLHRSPKTLSNLFTTCGLPSPLRIIHERIEAEAKRLLLYSQKSAKEITEILGFEDQATFSRFFKKMTGESVSEYRKREKRE